MTFFLIWWSMSNVKRLSTKIFWRLMQLTSIPDYISQHCVKCVQKRSFFSSVFSRIRTEHGVSLCIQSEYGKIRTRKHSVFGHFLRSVRLPNLTKYSSSISKEAIWRNQALINFKKLILDFIYLLFNLVYFSKKLFFRSWWPWF